MNKKVTQHTIYLSKKYDKAQLKEIGDLAIDLILKRTSKGLDEKNNKFKKYSKEWAKEKGVPRSKVDLEYTGDMLSELNILSLEPGKVTIGYPSGSAIGKQAEGNITGIRGKSTTPINPRPFLGIYKDDKEKILAKVSTPESSKVKKNISKFIDNLIGNQGKNFE